MRTALALALLLPLRHVRSAAPMHAMDARKEACQSSLQGDTGLKTCAAFCNKAHALNHCSWCKCKACAYCNMSCDVATLPETSTCTRTEITPGYLLAESACALDGPSHQHGLYQFGVPTEMAPTILRMRSLGIAYHSYWGFDSFQGLPPEDGRSKVPPGDVWRPGAFSEVHRVSGRFRTEKDRFGTQTYVPLTKTARPLTVQEACNEWGRRLNATENRVVLVPGFYNVSLTAALARGAPPAAYVDINCDLYISTRQALVWLFEHKIARAGTLISYDDWYEVPLGNGESLAHLEVSRQFRVEFEELPHLSCASKRRLIYFRVRTVGFKADSGVVALNSLNKNGGGGKAA
jgi:hypothetical protein